MNKDDLQKELCRQLCTNINLVERERGMLMVENPFSYPDGDHYSIYLKEIGAGQIRISDEANTMMRLSYDVSDVSKFFKGNKGKLMKQILMENKVQEDDGNFYVDTAVDKLSEGVFRLGQALSQIYDLSYLSSYRTPLTFYNDLEDCLRQITDKYHIELEKDYMVPNLKNAENYIVDYLLGQKKEPSLLLFGIPHIDKAKIVTITLQYFLIHEYKKPTLLIFQNQEKISPKHLSRLMDANVGGSQVSSIESRDAIERNIARYAVH